MASMLHSYQQMKRERDEARLIVHGMWSMQTPDERSVYIWNLAIERVMEWAGEGSAVLDLRAFGRALRGEAVDV